MNKINKSYCVLLIKQEGELNIGGKIDALEIQPCKLVQGENIWVWPISAAHCQANVWQTSTFCLNTRLKRVKSTKSVNIDQEGFDQMDYERIIIDLIN